MATSFLSRQAQVRIVLVVLAVLLAIFIFFFPKTVAQALFGASL